MIMSQINEMSDLPRGLVTRKGLPQTSTQRLPSLRSDVSASQLSPFVANATTKGGVIKRTFKPTIPAKRNINDSSQSSNDSSANTSRSRRGRTNGNNWNNRSKFDDKRMIQLEATVFNGDRSDNSDKQPRRSSNRGKDTIIRGNSNKTNGESLNVSIKTEPNIKTEKNSVVLRKLYGDNFIDDDEDDDYGNNHLLPKGWQAVSNHRGSNRCAEQMSPYNLFNSGENDKYLLMQFPESVLKRRDGHIGKIRVFKSGKIELLDNESETKYDIVYSKHSLPQVKSEHKFDNKAKGIYTQDISQDLVSFSENHLSLLGSLKHQQVLLTVPQIPFDEKISSSFQL